MQTLNFLFAPGIADVDPATVRVDLWAKCFGAGGTLGDSVPVQREMESERFPLV